MDVMRTTLPRAERQASPHPGAEFQARQFHDSTRKQLHTSNWNLSLHSTHTTNSHTQWPQSSDAPLSAQLALSAPQASIRAPKTLPLPPAAKPTRTPSSRAPARTPSSTYVDNACVFFSDTRKDAPERLPQSNRCSKASTCTAVLLRTQNQPMTT